MKKDRAVVFTVSSNLTFSIACVCMDIKKISPNLATEIVVFHDGITKKDQDLINAILPTRFIEYRMPFKDTSFIPNRILNYFTKMVFAKFECLRLLNEYKNVMLLDSDIVIQKDISELFDICDSGIKMLMGDFKVRGHLNYDVDEYDMEAFGTAAGTFVFQDHMKSYNEMYKFCYTSLRKYVDAISLPEQAIFDFMIQEYMLKVEPINIDVYSPHPTDTELASEAKIIHAYGQPKFWNGLENKQWNSNYAEWLAMGGSRYKKPTLLHRITKKIRNKLSK